MQTKTKYLPLRFKGIYLDIYYEYLASIQTQYVFIGAMTKHGFEWKLEPWLSLLKPWLFVSYS